MKKKIKEDFMKKYVVKTALGFSLVLILASVMFSTLMSAPSMPPSPLAITSAQVWGVAQKHSFGNIVIYRGQAYIAMQDIEKGAAPSQTNSGWRIIKNYSNPTWFRYDSIYIAGDIVRNLQNDIFVARQWVSGSAPSRHTLTGPWMFVSNYSPISGPIDRLPPHPGEEGKQTVIGIDSDGDGVRDDIQIAIAKLIPDDPYKRAAVMFSARMHQRRLAAFLNDTTQTFEQMESYFAGTSAGIAYWVNSDAWKEISLDRIQALWYNTRERFLVGRRIDRLANNRVFRADDIQEEYIRMFQETYERELERQR